MSQNNKEHRIHNRENSPYQISKLCVKLHLDLKNSITETSTLATLKIRTYT
jgi:hypothetical protein